MDGDSSLVIGVDLGGTKIEAVLARRSHDNSELSVLSRHRVPTQAALGYEAVLRAAAGLIAETARAHDLDPAAVPIGMGMPGGTTRRGGLVKNCNAVCLNGRPFRSDLERALGRSIAFDNDANLFALA
jgi:fructokinase